MKIYKIVANCARTTRRIQEIDERDVSGCIDEIVTEHLDHVPSFGDDDDSDEKFQAYLDKAYEALGKEFEKVGCLNCGDYIVIRLEDDEDPDKHIPNKAGYEDVDLLIDYYAKHE